jgi:YD repeat-containing protein
MSTIYSFEYGYDGVGNRDRLRRNLGPGAQDIYYYYDAANRLEKERNQTADSTTYFGYDGNGSVTRIQTAAGTTYFEYDVHDLVKKITYPGAGTNEFYYDGRNQRVVVKDSAGTCYFQWDGLNPIEERGADGAVIARSWQRSSGSPTAG